MINLGDLAGARECLTESLAIKRALNDENGIVNSELLLRGLEVLERVPAQTGYEWIKRYE
jgi:hypothetical protein